MDTVYEFDVKNTAPSNIIKIIGVGGGGGNAVNYMFSQGIKGVDFILCNTDIQALRSSPVLHKIQLGSALTEGLGAGADPEVGKNAAIESKEAVRQILSQNTKMAFITAGMGGGTGTGAAPVVAEICKSLGILTVGIVTMPFQFEGRPKELRAKIGVQELQKHCDTVLVILNNRILEYFGGKTPVKEAFNQADSVLSKAAKAIAEIITVEGMINVDFEDVKTVMKNSGVAVMGSHTCDGEDRAIKAAEGAINSPLLNNTNIKGAKRILLSIVAGNELDFQMKELEQITNFIQEKAGDEAELIYGQAFDPTIGNAINVTVIATGFDLPESEAKKTSAVKPVSLPVESAPVIDLETDKKKIPPTYRPTIDPNDFFSSNDDADDDINTLLDKPQQKSSLSQEPSHLKIVIEGDYEVIGLGNKEESKKKVSEKFNSNFSNQLKPISELSNDEIKNIQETPAYLRAGLSDSDTEMKGIKFSKVTLSSDNEILENNRFLHNNVD